MDIFSDEFRCITMDQRNANGGESSGPIPVDDPWGAFADDQLGLMDHLGIREFFFMGHCIGGCFALKVMERAPDRVVAGVLVQTVGHRDDDPDVMHRSGREVWAPELLARRPDLNMTMIENISITSIASNLTSFTASHVTLRAPARHPCWSCQTRPQRTRISHRLMSRRCARTRRSPCFHGASLRS